MNSDSGGTKSVGMKTVQMLSYPSLQGSTSRDVLRDRCGDCGSHTCLPAFARRKYRRASYRLPNTRYLN
jgi:hypothetical protein